MLVFNEDIQFISIFTTNINTLIPTFGGLVVKKTSSSHRNPLKPCSLGQRVVYSSVYCQANPLWSTPKVFCREIAQGPCHQGLALMGRGSRGNSARGPACRPPIAQHFGGSLAGLRSPAQQPPPAPGVQGAGRSWEFNLTSGGEASRDAA